MKELNTQEVQQVSGAGVIADTAEALGKGIGSIFDAFSKTGSTSASDALGSLGKGLGSIVESAFDFIGGLFGKKK